jgi:hypothetical protein
MARFARKSRIEDALLVDAIERAEKGLIDADLGCGVIKQRVGRPGQGRSGGYRTLIAFRSGDRAVFGFAKNEQDNISQDNLRNLRDVAAKWFATDSVDLTRAIDAGEIEEISDAKSE